MEHYVFWDALIHPYTYGEPTEDDGREMLWERTVNTLHRLYADPSGDFSVELMRGDLLAHEDERERQRILERMLHDMKDSESDLYRKVFLPYKEDYMDPDFTDEDAWVHYAYQLAELAVGERDSGESDNLEAWNETETWYFTFHMSESDMLYTFGKDRTELLNSIPFAGISVSEMDPEMITDCLLTKYYMMAIRDGAFGEAENRRLMSFHLSLHD